MLSKMYKFLICILCVLLCSCGTTYTPPPDTNHLYWKDIDVVITDVEQCVYGAAPAIRRAVKVSVYSEEYDITAVYKFYNVSIRDDCWAYEKGDVVKAQLYTWKNNVTGTINRRKIHKIY